MAGWLSGCLGGCLDASRVVSWGLGAFFGHESIGRTQPASVEHRYSQMLSIWCYTSIRSMESMAVAGRVDFSDPKNTMLLMDQPSSIRGCRDFDGSTWMLEENRQDFCHGLQLSGCDDQIWQGCHSDHNQGFLQVHRVHSSSHRRYVMYIYILYTYTLVYIIWYMYIYMV